MEPEDLRIVTPTAEDIPLAEAARLAGVGVKAIRRAVQAGHLPHRYAIGPRGLYLVFWRGDIERWRQRRGGYPTAGRRLGDHRVRSRAGGVDAREHVLALSGDDGGGLPPAVTEMLEEALDALLAMLPAHIAGQVTEAIAAMHAAWGRGDHAEALAQLRVWAGLLEVTAGDGKPE